MLPLSPDGGEQASRIGTVGHSSARWIGPGLGCTVTFSGGKNDVLVKPFAVEEWMNAYEDGARYNIAETCVDSVSLDELFAL